MRVRERRMLDCCRLHASAGTCHSAKVIQAQKAPMEQAQQHSGSGRPAPNASSSLL